MIETRIATPTIETVRAIHAALDAERPLALLHPSDDARQRELVEQADVPGDTAFVLFTSGSTAAPRGVVLSRSAIFAAAHASAAHLGWRDDDRWLACLPLAHAGGLSIIVRCYASGKPIVLGTPTAISDVTLASLVPTQLDALLADTSWRPPPQLRAVLVGGASASRALVDRALARGVPVLPTYGLTETFGQVATARSRGGPLVPLPGIEVVAGTPDEPTPIRIRGPMLATRYLDGEPIAPELVTSDLGYREGETLVVVGRRDDVIITGGENVHPAQVEAVLATTPGVIAAAAFGVLDERWGQIVAAALAVDARFDRSHAFAYWHSALPAHARPRLIATVAALPQLASGKIDRKRLLALPTEPVVY